MFSTLLILFTVLPALELYVLIKVGTLIGPSNTIALVILTGITGAWLARFQGFLVLQKIQNSLNQGILPSEELIDGGMILAGGIALLTPGFITDSIGLLLLFPISRAIIKTFLKRTLRSMIEKGSISTMHSSHPSQKRFKDIDI